MLKRILVIAAVLAGIATVALTQWETRKRVQLLATECERLTNESEEQRAAKNRFEQAAREKEAALAAATDSLRLARAEQSTSAARLAHMEKLAGELQQKLEQGKADLLALEKAKGDLNTAQKQKSELDTENSVLREELRMLAQKLDRQTTHTPPPDGLRGKVIAVDPKWQFVVLNIGKDQNAQTGWTFVVSRAGKLVGKVRISSVQGDRSVADVLPESKHDEVQEGDVVVPELLPTTPADRR
ncbi:MAG: hypothetical protein HZA90_07500 [Verrucomicrobia bacterium]|nr:hypothetical protein [Verrucomicrobiota bacterium]